MHPEFFFAVLKLDASTCNKPLHLSPSQTSGYISYTTQQQDASPSHTCRWTLSASRTQTFRFHLLGTNASLQAHNQRCPLTLTFSELSVTTASRKKVDLCRIDNAHSTPHLLFNTSSNTATFHFQQVDFENQRDVYALVQYTGE